jgi:hypothetical protein
VLERPPFFSFFLWGGGQPPWDAFQGGFFFLVGFSKFLNSLRISRKAD